MNPSPLVLLLALACGQQLTLPPEVKVESGELVIITAATDCKELQWLSPDPGLKLIPPSLLRDSKSAIGLAKREGIYTVYAYGARGDVPTPPVACKVIVGQGAPDPIKPPPPPPAEAKLQVTVVTDADHVDLALAELLRSKSLRESLGKAGHTLRLYDASSAVIDQQHLRPLVNTVGLPALIVQHPTGQVIRGLRAPTVESSFLDACRP